MSALQSIYMTNWHHHFIFRFNWEALQEAKIVMWTCDQGKHDGNYYNSLPQKTQLDAFFHKHTLTESQLTTGAAKWPEPQHDATGPAPLPPLLPRVDGQLGRFNDHWLVAKELRPPSNTNQQNGFVLLIYVNIIFIEIISVHSALSSLHLQTFERFTCKSLIYSLVVNQCIFQLNVKVALLLIFWHREWNEKKK